MKQQVFSIIIIIVFGINLTACTADNIIDETAYTTQATEGDDEDVIEEREDEESIINSNLSDGLLNE